MSKWSEYYKDRIGDGYAKYCRDRYAPMIEELERESAFAFREEGCGIGTISKVLLSSNFNRNIVLCDNDYDILRLAKENLVGHAADFQLWDCRIAPESSVDVTFGHGVLEHMSDADIARTLGRQLTYSRKVVHYVPTDGYDTQSFGDERLLPAEYWIGKWEPTRYETFNEDKDLLLVWE